jgi:hypothetical protein
MIKIISLIKFLKLYMQVIMVKGRRGSRRCGIGRRGVAPPIVSMPKGLNPREIGRLLSMSRLFWDM